MKKKQDTTVTMGANVRSNGRVVIGILLFRDRSQARLVSLGIQTETFIVYHLSEYLREATQRIENEAGCRHTEYRCFPLETSKLDHTPEAHTLEDWRRYRGTSR